MKSILKWLVIAGGVFFILLIAAVVIIPQFIDVKKYKPMVEEKVATATGRSFSIGDDLDLSIFPWVGVKITDVRFGNPEGFSQDQMISVDNFEVRLKVMPLLSRQIEIKTFVMDRPKILLEKLADGTANWENIGTGKEKKAEPKPKAEPGEPSKGLPVKDLKVGRFMITNGELIYNDQKSGMKKVVSDLNLTLTDISLDRPINIDFSAGLDGKPVSLKGTAGPIGEKPGKGTMTIDLALNLLNELDVMMKGSITDPAGSPVMDVNLDVKPFSPKKLVAALGMEMPLKPKDPAVLEKLGFSTRIKGSPKHIRFEDGKMQLDDSTLKFDAAAKDFQRPDLGFDLKLDQIDIDRYLPEPREKTEQAKKSDGKGEKPKGPAQQKKTDYTPLRKLVLDGKINIGLLKAGGATIENMIVNVMAKNGVISIDPAALDLYQGHVDSKAIVNVQKEVPSMAIKLNADKIQAGPLLKDALEKELIEGQLMAGLDLSMVGDTPDRIKKTLTGKGSIVFNDGAIIGIDLADSVRNVKSKLGLAEQPKEKPRTDFAELKIPFTAKKGQMNINGTSLISPLLRIFVSGDVNLPKSLLDLRVEPKFVATLKGQGDSEQRSGLMVPVLITGSFDSPKIRPDLSGMVKSGALNPDSLKKQILGDGEKPKIELNKEDVKKQIKSLIPGFGD